MNNNNYPNQFQNNNYYNNSFNQNYRDPGYSSMGMNNQQKGYSSQNNNIYNSNNNNMNNQPNFSNQINSQMSNNIRYTEAPNRPFKGPQDQSNANQKDISRMTEYNKGKERPLWSYREIKYDEFKQPRNTEFITTTTLNRGEGKKKEKEMPSKSDMEQFQKRDKIYFNNLKYQKVKVTKKVKDNEKIVQKRGPQDDFEQKLNNQNYNNNYNFDNNNNNQFNDNNNQFIDNNNNNFNNDYIDENENENIQNLNDDYNNNNNFNNDYIGENENIQNNNDNNNNNNNNDNDLQKDNYQIDIDTLAEVESAKNEPLEEDNEEVEYIPQLKENEENYNVIDDNNNGNFQDDNQNNNLNNQINPRPSFSKTIKQKVTDYIDQINTIPEANLQSWNLVADYTP